MFPWLAVGNMFPLVSKLLTPLVSPLGIACILWCVAALARFFKPRWSVPLLWASVGVLSVFSSKWVGNGLLGQLERQYSIVSVETVPQADVIVVLGGTTVPALAPRVEVEVTEAFDRLLHGMRLYRAGKAPHILLSGGTIPELSGSEQSEAEQLRLLALESGIPDAALYLEAKSRNTYENALYSARIMEAEGWKNALLVTSASHMPRAAGTFRAQGVNFVAAPTDVRSADSPFTPTHLMPTALGLVKSTAAAKEFVGWWVYVLRGWI